MEGKLKFLRYIAYGIEIIILFAICGTPGFFPEIMGVKPLLLLPVAIAVAVFEGEVPAMIVGFFCGLLTDLGMGTRIGFYTVALAVLCFVIGYCASNFFVTSFLNASVIAVFSVAILISMYFLFFVAPSGMKHLGAHYLRHYLIRIVYTLIFFPPLYWFNRLFRSTMKE